MSRAPKYVRYSGKVDDRYGIVLEFVDGSILDVGWGHIGALGGDYIRLEIDNATGRIMNWKPITAEDVKTELASRNDD